MKELFWIIAMLCFYRPYSLAQFKCFCLKIGYCNIANTMQLPDYNEHVFTGKLNTPATLSIKSPK